MTMTEEVPVDDDLATTTNDTTQQRQRNYRHRSDEYRAFRNFLKSGNNDNRFFLPSFFIQPQHEANTLHLHVYPHHTVAPLHIAIVMAYGTCKLEIKSVNYEL